MSALPIDFDTSSVSARQQAPATVGAGSNGGTSTTLPTGADLGLLSPTHPRTLVNSITVPELESGDLVFFSGTGRTQHLVSLARDRHRHVGIFAELNGNPWLLEAGRAGYRARPISTAVNAYVSAAVLRLSPCRDGCASAMVGRALEIMRRPTTYPSTSELAFIGSLSVARSSRPLVGRLLPSIYARSHQLYVDEPADYTLCSGFVFKTLALSCPRHLPKVQLGAPKDVGLDGSEASSYSMSTALALPDDLWRTTIESSRFTLEIE